MCVRRKLGPSVPFVAFQDLRNRYLGQEVMRLGIAGPTQQCLEVLLAPGVLLEEEEDQVLPWA